MKVEFERGRGCCDGCDFVGDIRIIEANSNAVGLCTACVSKLLNLIAVELTYTELFDRVQMKMLQDSENGKIDIDMFRRIGRGLDNVAAYLDEKTGRTE